MFITDKCATFGLRIQNIHRPNRINRYKLYLRHKLYSINNFVCVLQNQEAFPLYLSFISKGRNSNLFSPKKKPRSRDPFLRERVSSRPRLICFRFACTPNPYSIRYRLLIPLPHSPRYSRHSHASFLFFFTRISIVLTRFAQQ